MTLAAGFMGLLDITIVAVALPSIGTTLGATPAEVQWVASGYALTFGLSLVPAGRAGDAWGRRRMFCVSLAGFVLTSALCGAAPNLVTLVAARLAQGFTSGMLGPQNSGLIQDLFRGAERGRAFGLFGAVLGVSTAIGPVIGGLILAGFDEATGWRWIFLVNVPIGLLTLALAPRLLPGRPADVVRDPTPLWRRMDLVGGMLLGAGVLTLMFPLLEHDRFGRWWWLLLVAAALLFGFARWELRLSRRGLDPPMLEPRLLTDTPGYTFGAVLGLAFFIGFSGIWLVLAFFFQDGLGYTPLHSGLAVTTFAVGSAFSAMVSGRLLARMGRRLTVYGLVAMVVGLVGAAVALAGHTGSAAALWAAAPLALAGIGCGVVISPNITLTLSQVPVRMAGAAGGALQTGQRVGSAISTALLTAVYYVALDLSGNRPGVAILAALLCATGFVLVALVMALLEPRREA